MGLSKVGNLYHIPLILGGQMESSYYVPKDFVEALLSIDISKVLEEAQALCRPIRKIQAELKKNMWSEAARSSILRN